jgi:ABC-type dipeptide/oligopeptide/nickel transport system permease subunit
MKVTTWMGLFVLAVVGVLGVITGVLPSSWLPYDVVADVDPSAAGMAPSAAHWLGTDHLGRDVAWRLVLATRAFVGPGLLACALASIIGVGAGAISGYLGGPVAAWVRYLSTVTASIPRFVLVLLAIAINGNSTWLIGAVAGVAYSPAVAEAVFTRIDSLKRADFVLAARAHGLGPGRILLFHLLWVGCRRMVGRHALNLFGYLLLLETTLSYIGGFGVMEPQPSWGNMLAFEFGYRTDNIWGVWAPALAIWLTIFCCGLVSEALAERRRA